MLRNYMVSAFRGMLRRKAHHLIDILGLTVGLTASFMIFLWVADELRFDRFHEDGARIGRVMRHYHATDRIHTWQSTPLPLARTLVQEYPEIEDAVPVDYGQRLLFQEVDGKAFRMWGQFVGERFFDVFSFPLIQGDSEEALARPDAIVLSEDLAERCFGPGWRTQNLVGKTMAVEGREPFIITGVYKQPPRTSSIRQGFVASIEDARRRNPWLDQWGNSALKIYVRLSPHVTFEAANQAVQDALLVHGEVEETDVFLQPLHDIHLYTRFENGRAVGGRIETVRLFTAAGVLILLIACINYTNLTTARSSLRAREIGVRKAVGAGRRTLMRQFMGESLLVTAVAGTLAMGAIHFLAPAFSDLSGKYLETDFSDPTIVGAFLAAVAATGLLSGVYPALMLSSFNPSRVLRSLRDHRSGAARLRQVLVVFQFCASILLIVGTLTVYRQLDFIRTRDMGVDREHLLHLNLEGDAWTQFETFKQELLAHPEFQSITRSSQNPLSVGQSTSDPRWDGRDPEARHEIYIINADYDFVETMGVRLLRGHAFDPEWTMTGEMNFLVNQRMAETMGVDDPVGMELRFWDEPGRVAGLVEDFHMHSIHTSIGPLIIRLDPPEARSMYARIVPGAEQRAIGVLEDVYRAYNPNRPLPYRFVSEDFAGMYSSEAVLGKVSGLFAGLAGFLTCLGLLGLVSFMSHQRTREVGIRKALGATAASIVALLSGGVVKLVGVSFLISVPIAYVLLDNWLSEFAYRIEVGWWPFLASGGVALLVAWATAGSQTLRTALSNPTETLRVE